MTSSRVFRLWVFLYIVVHTTTVKSVNLQTCTTEVCEFHLTIDRGETMSTIIDGSTFPVALEKSTGRLRIVENSYRTAGEFPEIIGRYVDAKNVITADGVKRDVLTVNGQFPGPTIEVYQDSQVEVTVLNGLRTEATSIHWHGLDMRDNYYMDGVPYITQCPILPGQSFTYRFVAEPAGTHWYHSHLYNQRMDGLYGSGEFLTSYTRREYYLDGVELGAATYVSSLIDGRGHYPENDSTSGLPFAEYRLRTYGGCDDVTENSSADRSQCRFRLVNSASDFSYEVSIDGHVIRLLALDGHDIVATAVDSFVAHPGESFDFEIVPDNSEQINAVASTSSKMKYFLRAQTLGQRVGLEPNDSVSPIHEVRAVIVYVTTNTFDDVTYDHIRDPVTSSRRPCLGDRRCIVFNCPFGEYHPLSLNKSCLSLASIRRGGGSTTEDYRYRYGLDAIVQPHHEYFLNFGFVVGSSVNAVKFVWPTGLMSSSKVERYSVKCDEDETQCRREGCSCTNIRTLPYNVTVQMVLINYDTYPTLPGHHPIHLHGHSFAVLAVGFAPQNKLTGRRTGPNTAVSCDTKLCAAATWNEVSASKPDLNLVDPVVKDTVLVPASGYVVIRFRTDNPGLWLMHCHQEMHAIEGMSIVWNEAPERQHQHPEDFPTCGDTYRVATPNHAAAVKLHDRRRVTVTMVIMTALMLDKSL